MVLQQERVRALGQVASGVAHDINNAVSPLALYTEALLDTETGLSERTRRYLQAIQRTIDDVTHHVLPLTRSGTARKAADPYPVFSVHRTKASNERQISLAPT